MATPPSSTATRSSSSPTPTHPTRGLKDLLRNVCLRLTGSPHQIASIFRLDTNYGGGETHALIAGTHAIKGMAGVPNAAEFLDPTLLPATKVRVAAFDGENADPLSGRPLEPGLRAYTPWGELAYALAGREGYELVRNSDQQGGAPGAPTIRELFGGEPTLILMDELSIYLRKLKAKERELASGQLTAFLTSLFKAIESTPNAAVVYTLAIGKGGKATDAYSDENQFIADKMEEDETVKILRRRLFGRIDDSRATAVAEAYRQLWDQHREKLPPVGTRDSRLEAFTAGYPLRPDLHRRLAGPGHPERDRQIAWEAAKTRILSLLKDRARRGEQGLSNREIRQSGYAGTIQPTGR